jgi:predicted amidophosphoribosyltransferase
MLSPDSTAAIRSALADALALVLPVVCAGCGVPDTALCRECAAALEPLPIRRVIEPPGGPVAVWSGLAFEGVAARVIRSLKEDGRTPLARCLAPALRTALARLDAPGCVVVPMPTSRVSYRTRGFRVPDLLAARAGVPVARLLRPVRRTGDQRGLDRDARRANVARSMTARALPAWGPAWFAASRGAVGIPPVIVLDDVITTAASLEEAVRALRAAGAHVVGAVTVAATPLRMDGRRPRGDAFETHR